MSERKEKIIRCIAGVVSVAAVCVVVASLFIARPWESTSDNPFGWSDEQMEQIARSATATTQDLKYSGPIIVSEPDVGEFSSEEAWLEYEENWQDPTWEGEYPEGKRVKLASHEDSDWASWDTWVAGMYRVTIFPSSSGGAVIDSETCLQGLIDLFEAKSGFVVSGYPTENYDGINGVTAILCLDEDCDVSSTEPEGDTTIFENENKVDVTYLFGIEEDDFLEYVEYIKLYGETSE